MTGARPPSKSAAWPLVALRWLVAGAAAWYLVSYAAMACLRMAYPFELEWLEGHVLESVRRVALGQPLYVRPSLDFVPFIYAPLYYYVAAAAAKVTGLGFLPLRLVSFAGSLACAALLYRLARRETGSRWAGLLAAGFFAATFPLSGHWFDLARVDTLYLAILLSALYGARWWPSRGGQAAAGALFAVAFFAKQHALALFLPLVLYAMLYRRRTALAFVLPGLVGMGLGTWLWNRASGGWFWYYLFTLPSHHETIGEMYAGFWRHDLLGAVPVGCLLAAAGLAAVYRSERPALAFWALAAAGLLGQAWVARLHSGGYVNVLMPAHALLAVLLAVGAHRLAGIAAPAWRPLLACALCLWQLGALFSDLRAQVPAPANLAAGRAVVERLRAMPGKVALTDEGYLARLAGKTPTAHSVAVGDVLAGDDGPVAAALRQEIRQALRSRRFAAIITPGWAVFYGQGLQPHYRPAGRLEHDAAPRPVTGMPFGPDAIFTPVTPRLGAAHGAER